MNEISFKLRGDHTSNKNLADQYSVGTLITFIVIGTLVGAVIYYYLIGGLLYWNRHTARLDGSYRDVSCNSPFVTVYTCIIPDLHISSDHDIIIHSV